MTRWKLGMLALTGVLSAMSTIGCCDKEKKTISLLQADKEKLMMDMRKHQGDVAALKSREKDLLGKLDSKDTELLAASQRETDLRNQLAAATAAPPVEPPKPQPKPGAPGWEVGLTADKVSLTGDILFSAGQATLTSGGRGKLSQVVGALRSTYAGLPVRVYGFTDGDPIRKTAKLWKDNLDLSANRAMAVTRYLRAAGIPADQIETVCMGATRPVASNRTKSGKSKNRRVEIMVIKK